MKILHLVHQYMPDKVGGTELYTQALADGLAERGHPTAVFYRRGLTGQGCGMREDGLVKVWAAWQGKMTPRSRFLASFYSPAIEQAFRQVLVAFRPDLIHVQHGMGLPLSLLRSIPKHGIPYVMTLHDYWWVCANAQLITNYDQTICEGPSAHINCARCALARAGHAGFWPAIPALQLLLAWRNAYLRRVVRAAQVAIAPTDFVHRWYAARNVAAVQNIVIPHGIERPDSPLPAQPPEGLVRFVYLGGIAWQKGVHVIVEAFRALEQEQDASVPLAELWIAGDETHDPAYARHLHALATPNVRFCGRLSRTEVWSLLSQADVMLVPSLWYESFGLVVREAFVAGVPVIVSDVGALSEAVRDGVDGLRVPPGDVARWMAAMARLVEDAALRATMRSHIPKPLTLAAHITRVQEVYESVIAQSSSVASP